MEYLVLNNNTIAPACQAYSRACYGPCTDEPPCTHCASKAGCYPEFGPSKD